MEKLYTVSKNKTGGLTVAQIMNSFKFRLKLKKVGKTTRPFRYDLNQIPYNYTVELTNRFRGLDLLEQVPEELWMEIHDIVQDLSPFLWRAPPLEMRREPQEFFPDHAGKDPVSRAMRRTPLSY